MHKGKIHVFGLYNSKFFILSISLWLSLHVRHHGRQASLSFTISQSLPKFMSTESVTPSNHLILHCPLLLLPSIFPSIRVFSNELALFIVWLKHWSFSFSISPSNEYSWFTSFRIDWFYFFTVQGTLKSLLQHHSLKALIFQCSAFFMVQLSHPHMTTGKTKALTIWTFVNKMMSLLFNTLSRFVIVFLPRSNHFLISWLQSTIHREGICIHPEMNYIICNYDLPIFIYSFT